MDKNQTREAVDAVLRDIWQQQGCAYAAPMAVAYEPPRACVRCGRPIAPYVLERQPAATVCLYCRTGSTT